MRSSLVIFLHSLLLLPTLLSSYLSTPSQSLSADAGKQGNDHGKHTAGLWGRRAGHKGHRENACADTVCMRCASPRARRVACACMGGDPAIIARCQQEGDGKPDEGRVCPAIPYDPSPPSHPFSPFLFPSQPARARRGGCPTIFDRRPTRAGSASARRAERRRRKRSVR